MKKFLLACTALVALTGAARADAVLTFAALQTLVTQSASDPCIICATQQAHNPVGFGFNNFFGTGNDPVGNYFSTNQVGGSLGQGVETGAVPYTVGEIEGVFGGSARFGVAFDVNSANGQPAMTLDSFTLLEVDASDNTIAVIAHLDAPHLAPDIQNGNGFADYLISGFDLSSLQSGDRLIFHATFSGATDGGESFYLVPLSVQAVPEPATWAMMILGFLGIGVAAMRQRRRDGRGFRFI